MQKFLHFVSFFTFAFALGSTENSEGRCTCQISENKEMCMCTCQNLYSAEDLSNHALHFPKGCLDFQLLLLHSKFPFLTPEVFPSFQVIRFVLHLSNSTVHTLYSPCSPSCSLFQRLKFQSAIIKVENSGSLNGWEWEVFENFAPSRGTFELYLVKSDLTELPDEFSQVAKGRISTIRIFGCGLRWMGKKVFAQFSELRSLELSSNRLETIERSQLPKPGSKLSILDLGKNRLTVIPKDLCDGLNLETLILDGNDLLKLSESFLSNIRRAELHSDAGILFHCDCNKPWEIEEIHGRTHKEPICITGKKETPFLTFRKMCQHQE